MPLDWDKIRGREKSSNEYKTSNNNALNWDEIRGRNKTNSVPQGIPDTQLETPKSLPFKNEEKPNISNTFSKEQNMQFKNWLENEGTQNGNVVQKRNNFAGQMFENFVMGARSGIDNIGTQIGENLLASRNVATGLGLENVKAEDLANYSKGNKDIKAQNAMMKLKAEILTNNNAPRELYKLRDQIENGTYFGKPEEIKSTLNNIIGNQTEERRSNTKSAREYQQQLFKENQIYSGKELLNASNIVGNMLPVKAASSIAPGMGDVALFANAAGGAYNEALDNGAAPEQARTNATLSGATEWGLEKISGGLSNRAIGINGIIPINKLTSGIKNGAIKSSIDVGLDVVGEGLEEVASTIIQPHIDRITYDPNAPLATGEEMWSSFKDSILPTLMLQGIGTASSKINDIHKLEMQKIDTSNLPEEVKKQMKIELEKGKNDILQEVQTNDDNTQNINLSVGQNDLPTEVKNFVENRNKVAPGLKIALDNSISSDGVIIKKADGTREIKVNPNSTRAYEFVAVHEMLHDLEGTQEYTELQKFVQDRAIKHGDFEQSKQAITEQYQKFYQENGLDISKLDMNVETVNDMVAQAIGNQQFLNELATKKPNIFIKMYNWVKNVLLDGNKTGKTFDERRSDNKYLQELKAKFETAYKTNYKGDSGQQYSIQTRSDGSKYVRVDVDQDIFENKNLKQQKELAKRYILDNFRGNGIVRENDSINVSRKTANEYTNPKTALTKITLSDKLKASTELDNLLKISQYKYSRKDDGRHIFAKNGWDYYETTFQVGDKIYTGLLNIAKGEKGKLLYDITNIKERANNISVKTESVINPSFNNSIPSKNSTVNNKYMRNNEKNSQDSNNQSSFSMPNDSEWSKYLKENWDLMPNSSKTFGLPTTKQLQEFTKQQNKKIYENLYGEEKTQEKPKKDLVKKNNIKNEEVPSEQPIEQNNNKIRSWPETVKMNKKLSKDLDIESMDYEPLSNKNILEKADKYILKLGYDETLKTFKDKINSGAKIDTLDIVVGERLIQRAKEKGQYDVAVDLIQDVSIIATELGQTVQALSLIKKMTPEGQLSMLKKVIDRVNKNSTIESKVKISPEMAERIVGAKNQGELDLIMDEAKQEIANQLPVKASEKLRNWRYLAMLGNPRTHIRNILANTAMMPTVGVKNAFAKTIEDFASPLLTERTKTWKKSSKDVIDFVEQSATDMKDVISGNSKHNMNTELQNMRQIYKTKWLETTRKLNSDALEGEDWLFSKLAYKNALKNYLTANEIKTVEDIKNNQKLIKKAEMYAVEEAQKATFRQYSALASKINQIEKDGALADIILGGIVPFKKTPINVVKTGVRYSPIGLIDSITTQTYKLAKGKITANEYIDKISQGLTGTALTGLGYILASSGILVASIGGGKEEEYEEVIGKKMAYSIRIGNTNYDLSWLSPAAMPMFIGVELYNGMEKGEITDVNDAIDAFAKTVDPLSEMSMVSGINNALTNYTSGKDETSTNAISAVAKGALKSYGGQYLPTIGSQFNKVIDKKVRSTKASGTAKFKDLDNFARQSINKIPFGSFFLEPATDIWGNDIMRNDNPLIRSFEAFINPGNVNTNKTTKVDKEILNLYENTGEDSAIPAVPKNYFKKNNYRYDMTAEEYTKFKKDYGQKAYKSLEKLFKTKEYKKAEKIEQLKMIEKVYDDAQQKAREEYGLNVEDLVSKYGEEEASRRMLDVKQQEKYAKAEKAGISLIDYYNAWQSQKDIKGNKDRYGKTVSGSEKKNKRKAVNKVTEDLSMQQRRLLYGIFNIKESLK